MKQFLLSIIIALPSFVVAQPNLTFTPGNGATNVSTTADLTITSDVGLKNAAGDNLSSTNVDILISITGGSSGTVAFDATVDPSRTSITINPNASLEELTTYTLTLQPVENNTGDETTTKVITFTTGDFTDPGFTVSQAINNQGDGFTFRVNVDENATVYYVVDRSGTAPTIAEIRGGDKSGGANAEASGSFTVTANTNVDENISGLDFTPPVKFNIYFFAEDNATPKNTGTVITRGIPLLNSSSSLNPAPTAFDLRVNIDEPVTTYYVVTQSASQPSAAQILAGQNESGGTPDQAGSFPVATGNTNTDGTITGLADLTTYYVHFVSIDGAGNQTIVETETATTTDGTPPAVLTLSPADGSAGVDISANTFTITFDENVTTINVAASDNTQRIRLFEEGVMVEDIDRNDTSVGTDGSIIADGTTPTATITFAYDLLPYKNYHILIGSEVFEDAAQNDFTGLLAATDWTFTTSGVTVNNTSNNICSGSFQSLGNIVISENGVADFNTGASQTLILGLENTSEFVISNSGVSVSGSSTDITALSVSVGLTTLTITYTVVSGTVMDNITISGLKVYATGAVANTTIIRTGGNADQDGNNGTGIANSITYATINVGASPPSQPQLDVSQDVDHCVGEDLTAKTLTLVDQGAVTYNWYKDAALTDLATSTTNETVLIAADLDMVSPAVLGTYKFYVVAVSSCQSAPPVEVIVRVGSNPVANAGADKTAAGAVCSGADFTLGGNPTLVTPSAPGSYSYNWQWLESAPEPDPSANPVYSISNGSTTTAALHNFEVTITDIYGCLGKDTVTVEVKPTFTVSLISPNSNTFTPESPNQTLEASVTGGIFSGVGVVQSNPGVYQFSPPTAHATDPNTLPKFFPLYYTVSSNGCTQENVLIATFTISNSFFSTLQPEYCSNEFPDPTVAGVNLSVDASGYALIETKKTSWNTNERFARGPYNNPWQSGGFYSDGEYVRYNNEIYRCNGGFLFGCSGFSPPDSGSPWTLENILKVNFNGLIANFYEHFYGGNASGPTIVKSTSTYTVSTRVFNYYRLGTNVNYNDCAKCDFAQPGAYLEFQRPEDIRLLIPTWTGRAYYIGELVNYGGNIYRCIANFSFGVPASTPSQWTNVSNSDYADDRFIHKWDADIGAFRAGFKVNDQYVRINRNPDVFFSGLPKNQIACEYSVLNLDNVASSSGNVYDLTGNLSKGNFIQEFLVRLDGSGTLDDGGGTVTNDIFNPGTATFDTKLAFENSPGGAATAKNIEVQYKVDPGTDGSTLQPCYGTSSVIVQVRQNSSFNFASTVDPEGSVYCYLEAPKQIQSVTAASTPITGAAGTAGSVVYSGYGVTNAGNSEASFSAKAAIDLVNPGTTAQQLISVTATYRDASQCQSTRMRTFKVNPDIQPSFLYGGRTNYCYEDITNSFTGHFQDFTHSSGTVTSSGKYDFIFYDPGNVSHTLATVSSNNATFTADVLYDEIQQILNSGGFTGYVNQTASVNVVYTESVNAGKVCSETFEQKMVINPPLILDIFGFSEGDVLCRNNNSNLSQGNTVVFEGSQKGSGSFKMDDDTDFSTPNTNFNGTVLTNAGQATINLLSAYNASTVTVGSGRRQVYLQYEFTAAGCTGPADVIKGFEISPPPSISFNTTAGNSPPNLEVFCKEEAPVQLKTYETTNVTFSGYGITDGGNGIATFNPALGFNTSVSNGGTLSNPQDITVRARISDSYGCANEATLLYTVNPTPPANVNLNGLGYCYEDAPRTLQGDQAKSWFSIEYQGVTTPYTENIGDINNPVAQITFNPRARFDHAVSLGASTLTPADFNVYYTTADAQNCTNTLGPFTLSVANLIDVSIAGLDDGDIYCSNENNGSKEISFNPFPSDATKRRFLKDGQVEPLSSNKFAFEPGLPGGNFELIYIVYSGENDCSNTDTTRVTVLPSPRALFSAPPKCEGDLIDFMADGSENQSSALYTWTLDDSVRTGQNIQHRFPGTNNYGVNLLVQYPAFDTGQELLVCQDSLRRDQVVGQVPEALNFKFFNVCEEDPTRFEIQPDIPVNRVSWKFGDDVNTGLGFTANDIPASVPNTTGTYQAPVHRYLSANTYDVIVTAKTSDFFGGCELTDTVAVAILKNWAPSGGQNMYDMSLLDGGKGHWVVEDEKGNATWDFNAPIKNMIRTNEMAWVTGATLPYKSEDASYVNSPCFDLSAFDRPVLSLKHWTDTEPSDGAVLQYSVDGGETWQRLGNVASGLDWYNRVTISSNPGSQDGLTSGWSLAEQEAWATGKHALDVLGWPRTQVRFRVAFSSFINANGKDGFAFNNVVIEERNRTILVENFTELAATDNNQRFKEFRANAQGVFNPTELVKLQYHHASTQNDTPPDILHRDNPVDQNARAAFYGVTNAVRAFVDGGYGQTAPNPTFTAGPLLDTYFSLRSLVVSPVDIAIGFETEPAGKLNVKATVKATNNVGSPGQHNVFIAIAEKDTLGQVYVLRKFLPSAAGTPLASLAPTDPAQEIRASYDMRHVTRLPNGEFRPFAVIVFVQNLETKDVLQASMWQNGLAPTDIITGVETSPDNYIRLYPNPADAELNIVLPSAVREETPVKLFDTFGKQVYSGIFKTGEHVKTLQTKVLASGIYLIQLSTPQGFVLKKAIVAHE